jgi:hypothetical protein
MRQPQHGSQMMSPTECGHGCEDEINVRELVMKSGENDEMKGGLAHREYYASEP